MASLPRNRSRLFSPASSHSLILFAHVALIFSPSIPFFYPSSISWASIGERVGGGASWGEHRRGRAVAPPGASTGKGWGAWRGDGRPSRNRRPSSAASPPRHPPRPRCRPHRRSFLHRSRRSRHLIGGSVQSSLPRSRGPSSHLSPALALSDLMPRGFCFSPCRLIWLRVVCILASLEVCC